MGKRGGRAIFATTQSLKRCPVRFRSSRVERGAVESSRWFSLWVPMVWPSGGCGGRGPDTAGHAADQEIVASRSARPKHVEHAIGEGGIGPSSRSSTTSLSRAAANGCIAPIRLRGNSRGSIVSTVGAERIPDCRTIGGARLRGREREPVIRSTKSAPKHEMRFRQYAGGDFLPVQRAP